jgi:hypothetical protein
MSKTSNGCFGEGVRSGYAKLAVTMHSLTCVLTLTGTNMTVQRPVTAYTAVFNKKEY